MSQNCRCKKAFSVDRDQTTIMEYFDSDFALLAKVKGPSNIPIQPSGLYWRTTKEKKIKDGLKIALSFMHHYLK